MHRFDLSTPVGEIVVWETMPLLGTGKTDHLTVTRMVRESAAAKTAEG